jgi:AAA+ ATPase superfamily predicted ATPase
MELTGRKEERAELKRYYDSGRPELLVVYGRRRVGKTYLIKEYFGKFAFYFTGTVGATNEAHLNYFDEALAEYGGDKAGKVGKAGKRSSNWREAFEKLRRLLTTRKKVRQVVFFDETPWLDTPGSDFLTAFDYFWNSWASAQPSILFIVCGSSTSWITKKLLLNRGGLHNRVTGRLHLAPFTLGECEEFFKSRGITVTRYQIIECYMIFGGIPYYLNLFARRASLSQNVDRLCFAENAMLKDEYRELYYSLFNRPERHLNVIETLATRQSGMTRNEISQKCGVMANGHLTNTLTELELCDFIETYTDFTRPKNGRYYYLKDAFSLFYLRYMQDNNTKDEYFWTNHIDEGGRRAWSGYAFEMVCRSHLRQMKVKLGIAGVSTSVTAWRSRQPDSAAQIDLLINRRDGVINLCEMKYAAHPYTVDKAEAEMLQRKREQFRAETKVRSALHITFVTSYGLSEKGYCSVAEAEITMDDLFTD